MENEKVKLIYSIMSLLAQSEEPEDAELLSELLFGDWAGMTIEDLEHLELSLL